MNAMPNAHAVCTPKWTRLHVTPSTCGVEYYCFVCFREMSMEQSERGEQMQSLLVFTLISCSQVDPSSICFFFFIIFCCFCETKVKRKFGFLGDFWTRLSAEAEKQITCGGRCVKNTRKQTQNEKKKKRIGIAELRARMNHLSVI